MNHLYIIKQQINKTHFCLFLLQVDPTTTSIILFPGQGAQFVGMGKALQQNTNAMNTFAEASEILKYDLLKVCLEGPIEMLNRTETCQLATLVTSLAGVELLRDKYPEVCQTSLM